LGCRAGVVFAATGCDKGGTCNNEGKKSVH
jgi:hypothetical protein